MASVLSENATNDWHQGGGNELYKASCSHLTIQCCFSLLALNVVVTARLLLSCKQIMRIKVSQITVYHCSMYIVCSRHSHSIYSICCLNCTYDICISYIIYHMCVYIILGPDTTNGVLKASDTVAVDIQLLQESNVFLDVVLKARGVSYLNR